MMRIAELTVLLLTGEKMKSIFKYDLAISFSGEDRRIAEQIASLLNRKGICVFYDEFEKAELWGKDLYTHLTEIYRNRARFCLILVSQSYAEKQWTNLERKAAQARAFEENIEYILPLKIDDIEIAGILPTVGHISFTTHSIPEIVELIIQKIKQHKSNI